MPAAGAFIGNVGKMIAAGRGHRYVLVVATTGLNMPRESAALTILLVLGVVLFILFDAIDGYAAPWPIAVEIW